MYRWLLKVTSGLANDIKGVLGKSGPLWFEHAQENPGIRQVLLELLRTVQGKTSG
jgi:hypothetical protein